jgi:hypothetical protein
LLLRSGPFEEEDEEEDEDEDEEEDEEEPCWGSVVFVLW